MNNIIVFVNGEFLPANQAKISIFDRGFLMSDAVYEVSAVVNGKLIDNKAHLQRLERSLEALNIPLPMSITDIINMQRQIIAKNGIQNGGVYLQITRGEGQRNFVIDSTMTPTIIMFPLFHDALQDDGATLRVITQPDIRWLRRDIKTTQLLAQSLAKTAALELGVDDVWMVDADGYITEGASNNAYIVKNDRIFTRPANHEILNGITRQRLLLIAKSFGLTVIEEKFSLEEAVQADEAFITSASAWVLPVVEIDGNTIGTGERGPMTKKLREGYIRLLETLMD